MQLYDRTEKLIGAEGVSKLKRSRVLIVGLGGVGGYVLEMLLRAGVGAFTLVDGDCVDETNLNRQILATAQTVGAHKTEAALTRIRQVNAQADVKLFPLRYNMQTREQIFLAGPYDYVVDCIDSVPDKADLIAFAASGGMRVIAAMGAGNRIAPKYEVTDLFKTAYDGLARAVRHRLRHENISGVKCVCDSNLPIKLDGVPGSISFAPALMGCMMGAEIIKDLLC